MGLKDVVAAGPASAEGGLAMLLASSRAASSWMSGFASGPLSGWIIFLLAMGTLPVAVGLFSGSAGDEGTFGCVIGLGAMLSGGVAGGTGLAVGAGPTDGVTGGIGATGAALGCGAAGIVPLPATSGLVLSARSCIASAKTASSWAAELLGSATGVVSGAVCMKLLICEATVACSSLVDGAAGAMAAGVGIGAATGVTAGAAPGSGGRLGVEAAGTGAAGAGVACGGAGTTGGWLAPIVGLNIVGGVATGGAGTTAGAATGLGAAAGIAGAGATGVAGAATGVDTGAGVVGAAGAALGAGAAAASDEVSPSNSCAVFTMSSRVTCDFTR